MTRTKPYELELNALDLKRFSFDKAKRLLTAEASDFGDTRTSYGLLFQRLYNDACDVGFAIKSHLTGRSEKFSLETEHTDREGDITHWTFKPINKLAHVEQVIVFND